MPRLGCGQMSLFNLLKAYSLLDSEVGYCQGLSFVAGLLLMHVSWRCLAWVKYRFDCVIVRHFNIYFCGSNEDYHMTISFVKARPPIFLKVSLLALITNIQMKYETASFQLRVPK